ncbi:MAG: NUDIX domain-containing protein [Chloroflexi bacterium]|nr:NUDIX domain-containing protein [Chloroflexota bacterium]
MIPLCLRSFKGRLGEGRGEFLELGETVEEAARREVREEVGLEVGELELIGVVSGPETYYVYPNGDQVYGVMAYFLARAVSGELRVGEAEAPAARYFALSALPDHLDRSTRRELEAFRARLTGGSSG